ncbi:MAG: DUF4340 domain-containing protein [bacterium]|nr:DUF4340 domain-containing protein [bacterium]
MSFKRTGLFALVFVLLLGYLYFYDNPRIEEAQRQANAPRHVVEVAKQKVARLHLKNQDFEMVAERRGQDWQILQPVKTGGDWGMLEGLILAAKEVEQGRTVADSVDLGEGQVQLAGFGLDPPRVTVRFEGDGEEPVVLFFGNDNPDGRAAYLSWGNQQRVVLTQRWRRHQFEAPLLNFRDKRVVPFDMDLVEKLEVHLAGRKIVASKQGLQWHLEEPVQDRGDNAAIQRFLEQLRAGRAEGFATENGQELGKFGLDKPHLQITVYEGKEGVAKTVRFGGVPPGDNTDSRYGKFEGWPHVFVVERFLIEDLSVTSSDLREKLIFGFDASEIDEIRQIFPDSQVVCVKTSETDWTVQMPEGHTVHPVDVRDWIHLVDQLPAQDYVAESLAEPARFGLDRPVMTVQLLKQGTLVREVRLGRRGERLFAVGNGRPQVVEVAREVPRGLKLNLKRAADSSEGGS